MAGLPIVCPVCAASFPAEAGLADADARRALAVALELWPGPLQANALVYIGMHAPTGKRISWTKLTRLLGEFVALIQSGQVTRSRETRPAPLAAWADGMAEIIAMRDAGRLDLPLGGHGLLMEIVHRRASKQAAQAQARDRPLHPSHRPAPLADPVGAFDQNRAFAPTQAPTPDAPPPDAPPRDRDWQHARARGAVHVGALLGKLRPVGANSFAPTPTTDDPATTGD